MTHPPILRFEGLRKTYPGGAKAVLGLDLEIEQGSFVALLGPSGCGKTTTLRMVGGFETPEAGRIFLNGQDITNLPPEARNVNMLFQDYALFPHLTVAQNVAFGLETRKIARGLIEARVRELLAMVELTDFATRKPAQLSGGQRQRVGLARALAPDPAVLLLDEPLAALDAKLRGQMQFELKSLQRRTGKTFLFVTHDQEEALALSDRIIVMNKGAIEQNGTPEDLYYRPQTSFVAGFVGSSSRLAGQITQCLGETAEITGEGFRLRGRLADPTLEIGAKVVAFIRPETVQLTEPSYDFEPAILEGRAFVGGKTLLELRLPDGAELIAQHTAATPEPALGSPLGFDVSPERVLLFAA